MARIIEEFCDIYGVKNHSIVIDKGCIVALARNGPMPLYTLQKDVMNLTNISAIHSDYMKILFPSVSNELKHVEREALASFKERYDVDESEIIVKDGCIFFVEGTNNLHILQRIDYFEPMTDKGMEWAQMDRFGIIRREDIEFEIED